jgi:hypothetical protein
MTGPRTFAAENVSTTSRTEQRPLIPTPAATEIGAEKIDDPEVLNEDPCDTGSRMESISAAITAPDEDKPPLHNADPRTLT